MARYWNGLVRSLLDTAIGRAADNQQSSSSLPQKFLSRKFTQVFIKFLDTLADLAFSRAINIVVDLYAGVD